MMDLYSLPVWNPPHMMVVAVQGAPISEVTVRQQVLNVTWHYLSQSDVMVKRSNLHRPCLPFRPISFAPTFKCHPASICLEPTLLLYNIPVLWIIIIDHTPSFVACSHRTTSTPPTNIAQERIKQCQFILDTVPREHVEILK